jgi:threonine synthase
VPVGTAAERIAPVAARGAVVIQAGTDPSEAYKAADLVAAELGLTRLYSTFAAPLAEWACRMIGVEATRQLGTAPASIVAPISAGPVLVGTGNGVAQETSRLPALIAVQAEGCCPIARAFAAGRQEVQPWAGPVVTAATSIADRLRGYPQDGTYTLGLIVRTGGQAVAVSDDEMREARGALLRFDGLDAELSAAAGVAWLMRGQPGIEGPVVCVVTASGFKHTYRGDVPEKKPSAERRATTDRICATVSSHGIDARVL